MTDKEPTIDTCVLSGKPIRQKHIDKELVIQYGRGRAFISAIISTVRNPPVNPVVFGANQLSAVSLSYEKYNFPERIILQGKTYNNFPQFIYIQNQIFKFHGSNVVHSFVKPDGLMDGKTEIGIVVYKRTKESPEYPKKEDSEVDKEE